MRHVFVFAAVLGAITGAASSARALGGAANAFGEAGQFVPYGSVAVGFESQGDLDEFKLELDPGLLYFVTDRWAVGGTLKFDAWAGDLDFVTFGMGPTVAYNYPLSPDFSFFPQGQLYFTVGGGDVQRDSVGIAAFAPFLWHVVPNFFLGVGPDMQIDFHNDAGELFRLGGRSVIGGYF